MANIVVRRRRRAYVFLALIALALLFAYKNTDTFHAQSSFRTPSSAVDFFKWRNVKIRYPVQRLKSLSSRGSKKLPQIQHNFDAESELERSTRLERRQAIKDAFVKCHTSYVEKAWMKDELLPVSGSARDAFGGWAATLVDSLDTLWIMGMKKEFHSAIQGVGQIDFSTSTEKVVNVFETTIRYLGGLLSAYDLSGDTVLLNKAIELGEMLLVAFDTSNHLPITRWNWRDAADGNDQRPTERAFLAELGSLSLEFTRLSQLTNDMRWYDAITRITELFAAQQKRTRLPGLWPINVNPQAASLTGDGDFSLSGAADSAYEYFPKMYSLLGGREAVYQRLYKASMKTAVDHLLFRPMMPQQYDVLLPGNIFASNRDEYFFDAQVEHLSCYVGGMFALGGKLFKMPDHVTIARKLVDGCIWAYNASARGIMPEKVRLVPCEPTDACPWDEKAWRNIVKTTWEGDISTGKSLDKVIAENRLRPGFVQMNGHGYALRPEAIESIFILYRITGEKRLLDEAWKMWTTIQTLTETEYCNAELRDVTYEYMPVPKIDRMESFWMAETLKYFYLIFSEPDLISLDEYVFNTEAHPFRRPQ